MKEKALNTSFYIPAHIERAGFYQDAFNRGTDVEHFREYNNTAPTVAFGVEFAPGHQASVNRGEFSPTFNSTVAGYTNAASVGNRTYGGVGIYASKIGGVWDALLGEGRGFWFFASSDYPTSRPPAMAGNGHSRKRLSGGRNQPMISRKVATD